LSQSARWYGEERFGSLDARFNLAARQVLIDAARIEFEALPPFRLPFLDGAVQLGEYSPLSL